MSLHQLFQRLADDGVAESAWEQALRGVLAPAGLLYGIGAAGARHLYDLGIRKRTELPVSVLSVGNITLGGTGKTPFVAWLSRWLVETGRRPAVISRGYGREDESRLVVVHDGRRQRVSAKDGGDEPVLLARLLGNVPIIATSNRAEGARLALRRMNADVIVLDDGFQHHRLARQGDIVLLDATRPLTKLSVFPRGTLREPLSGISRAHLIVLTRWNQAGRAGKSLAMWLRNNHPELPVARMTVVPESFVHLATGETERLATRNGQTALLVCGVGNPGSVVRTAREAGLKVVARKILPDHAEITPAMMKKFEAARRNAGADILLMTEKDAARASGRASFPASALALRIRLAFAAREDEERAVRTLSARLAVRPVRGLLR
jgi:tetraacyldisaccharide 4'-kinase